MRMAKKKIKQDSGLDKIAKIVLIQFSSSVGFDIQIRTIVFSL
jgi:hypothetical protein